MTAPNTNNHEIFTKLMDTSDGKGADGVQHPDLKAKPDTGAVAVDSVALKKRMHETSNKNLEASLNGDDATYNKTIKEGRAQTDTLETLRGHGNDIRVLPGFAGTKPPNVKPK